VKKQAQGMQQSHHARITETQRRSSLLVDDGWFLQAIEGILG
jgi:hypothetical protein